MFNNIENDINTDLAAAHSIIINNIKMTHTGRAPDRDDMGSRLGHGYTGSSPGIIPALQNGTAPYGE